MELIDVACERAANFRDKHNLGNYCGKTILNVLSKLMICENIKIKLIRKPFSNMKLAGFIGFKHNMFIIVINSNQTLGNEVFTIVHEIYHLTENRVQVKKNTIIEIANGNDDPNEKMANWFAAELLMPKDDILCELKRITEEGTKRIDYSTVIMLQQTYGVDYIAIIRRLLEINAINTKQKNELEEVLKINGELKRLTLNLGYENSINEASKEVYLLPDDLKIIRANYENGDIDFDDLIRIFDYLGCSPQKFGYTRDFELSDEDKEFLKSLSDGTGSGEFAKD